MENTEEIGNGRNVSTAAAAATTNSSSYKLFGGQRSIHQFLGGGKAADVILWRKWRVSCGIIVAATVAWIMFEKSGLSFLSICSDVLLIIVVLMFLSSNYADSKNRQFEILPELALSEEMVNNAAASFRLKINYTLLMAREITLGKDCKLFFKTNGIHPPLPHGSRSCILLLAFKYILTGSRKFTSDLFLKYALPMKSNEGMG